MRQVDRQTLAGFPGLTVGHVIEDVLHGPAVRQAAVRQLSVTLLPTLTLMSVKQEDELLLDQLPLLGISHRGSHRLSAHAHTHTQRGNKYYSLSFTKLQYSSVAQLSNLD